MKKTNNKGFSLVELIIVIAIMAILAGAIAPALIRYIDKSRKSNDVSSCKSIKTAVETALGNEDVYAYLTSVANATDYNAVKIAPGVATSGGDDTAAITITITGDTPSDLPDDIEDTAKSEIGTNIGEKTPKIKYKKTSVDDIGKPSEFWALISPKGTVYVLIGTGDQPSITVDGNNITSSDGYLISPEACDSYK